MTIRAEYPAVQVQLNDAPPHPSRRSVDGWSIRTASITAGVGLLLWVIVPEIRRRGVRLPVAKATPVAQLTPAPRGQASEYNYMKRALDRAATVRDQARDQTRAAQNP